MLMSNAQLFNQISTMRNAIRSMANHMEIIERKRRFMMGSSQNFEQSNNSMGERCQFGYDPRCRPAEQRHEERRLLEGPRLNDSLLQHRPGKDPMGSQPERS